jgi:hypothetical protein
METRHSGLLFPSKGPTFLFRWDSHFWLSASGPDGFPAHRHGVQTEWLESLSLINFPRHGDIQLMQHVRHFCFPQPGGVILE